MSSRAGPAMIGRGLDDRRAVQIGQPPGELLLPVSELRRQHLPVQPVALPLGEVRVLERELGERRRPPGAEGLVEDRELAREQPRGPAVGDDVVHHDEQHVLALAEPVEHRAQQRAGAEIEGTVGLHGREPEQLRLAPVLARRAEVDAHQRVQPRGMHDLDGTRLRGLEGRPQRFVAAHDLIEAALERLRVQLALEPEGEVHVVDRPPGLQLVEEPEPLLRVRQAHVPARDGVRSGAARSPALGARRAAPASPARANGRFQQPIAPFPALVRDAASIASADGGERVIEALFPDGVVTVESTDAAPEDVLRPEEAAGLGRAVEKRRREFAAGRACARRALARLEIADSVLPVGPDRLPAWPAGIVGSITHCAGYAGVAVARRGAILGLGLDAEVGGELEPALVPLVCLPSEIEALRALPRLTSGEGAKLVFSAKESAYKCWFPLVHRFLEFHDVEVELRFESLRAGSFTARVLKEPTPVSRFHGRFLRDDARVYTGVTLLDEP